MELQQGRKEEEEGNASSADTGNIQVCAVQDFYYAVD